MLSPTLPNGSLASHQSTRSKAWPGQLCSSSGWLNCATRLTSSPLSSTSRLTSWGSPPAMFRLCGSSPREVEKASCQARLLSGRYRLEALSGHWTPWNKEGLCTLTECWRTAHVHKGTVESLLTSCHSLTPTRVAALEHTRQVMMSDSVLQQLVHQCLSQDAVQFWLDCSTMALVISAVQQHGQGLLSTLLRLTRNFCFVIHKAREDMLGES